MKIALIGYGAMGKHVERMAGERGHSIVFIADKSFASATAAELAAELAGSDAAIDFSAVDAAVRNVEACVLAHVPLVEGTTGWGDRRTHIERIVTDGRGSFLFGANFSIGVNLFYRISEFAGRLLSRFDEYEVFIEEQHHSRKKDAPSGTALKVKEIVERHISGSAAIASTRAGSIPGTHRLGFDGPADQIVIEHTARSRDGFAAGAVMAAEWIIGKTGIFEFGEVIDEMLGDL